MLTAENPLQLSGINVVVAGGGGIARALVARLLDGYPVQRLFCLQRGTQPIADDTRVLHLPVDADHPASVEAAADAIARDCERLHLVLNTVGLLHAEGVRPEKRLQDVRQETLGKLMTVNAFFVAHLAAALAPLLKHPEPALLASLSARVGSITDNRMGGWYAYRASKAAHNMLLRTLACEWRLSHRNACVVALHPGTVKTRLSAPFITPAYKNRVLSADECAAALLLVLETLTPEHSGTFLDWNGKPIAW